MRQKNGPNRMPAEHSGQSHSNRGGMAAYKRIRIIFYWVIFFMVLLILYTAYAKEIDQWLSSN